MGNAIGLERVETLEIEQRFDQAAASRVALGDGHQVGAKRVAQRRFGRDHLVEQFVQEAGIQRRVLEPARKPVAYGVLEPVMVQNRGIDEAAECGLGRADLLGLAPHLAPDRIVALDVPFFGRQGF
jgi:hypothetical protein